MIERHFANAMNCASINGDNASVLIPAKFPNLFNKFENFNLTTTNTILLSKLLIIKSSRKILMKSLLRPSTKTKSDQTKPPNEYIKLSAKIYVKCVAISSCANNCFSKNFGLLPMLYSNILRFTKIFIMTILC